MIFITIYLHSLTILQSYRIVKSSIKFIISAIKYIIKTGLKMKTITLLGALTAIALSVNVQANQDVSGFYLGAGVGTTNIDTDNDGHSYPNDTDGNTFKFIGGYQFNRIVAIEAQYTKYGKISPDTSTLNSSSFKWKPTTISLAANLGYTFENGLRPFATIGLSSLDLDQSEKVFDDGSATALRFGAGLEYTPASLGGISFRGGYEGDAFALDNGSYTSDTTVFLGSLYVAASYKF
ncbi:MAG: opacity protein-like surface antigen [Moritella dasanensis]|jgi:opacity protein-like surface antigen